MTDIPRHVGIILDGNRRWARKHGLPTYEGHLAGYNAVREVALELLAAGVEFLTVYVFSIENWQREETEVNNIMSLMLKAFSSDIKTFDEKNVKLQILGSTDRLTKKMIQSIDDVQKRTANNTGGTMNICFNYSGQQEIADAVKSILAEGMTGDDITPATIEQHLYAPEVPSLDIVVRTGGEQRLSNFMLWRAAYSEFMFVDKMWPEMTKADIDAILEEYSSRQRRFGK